ncbi:rhamnogalacturonan acetylesterase [Gracilibacillus sp. YIM 98692]|uniref:rhamnogalacturonan acetylesterase n=1 Tax=Gracilibacillus sp. YIM 98692 TaxID=2663532 RepID=UPI0013D5CDF3|nr:rhamnogalacturonan acetylesterase [Gracilibacillus sp. YIM 98692]
MSIQLFLAGDSTMSDYDYTRYPRMGWGQVLSDYLDERVNVRNHAASGRSSKSFIDEKRWTEMEKQFQKGDYLVIQFGHNDQKPDEERATQPFSSYQDNLRFFIRQGRSNGVCPILSTSIARRHFNKKGELQDTHGEYLKAVRDLAKEEEVPLVDMAKLTGAALQELGDQRSKEWFMWADPGVYEAYLNGEKDDTHLNETGAREHAKLFVREIVRMDHPLNEYVKL